MWGYRKDAVLRVSGIQFDASIHSHTHTDSLYVRERAAQRREREREKRISHSNECYLLTDSGMVAIFSAEGTKLHCCLQTTHTHVYE